MSVLWQGTSRESLRTVGGTADTALDGMTADSAVELGRELFAFVRLLDSQAQLRRLLTDPGAPPESRVGLARTLLGAGRSDAVVELASALVSTAWSRPSDLPAAAEVLARRSVLAGAEKNDDLAEVEDELFRFGRILDREPELSGLLADVATPVEGRLGLLEKLLGGETSAGGSASKVRPATAVLLTESVRGPRGRKLEDTAAELAEEAAARRERSVAKVRTPMALTEQQQQKLADTLGRMYGRAVSLQIELDESLLGGLVVSIGDEVIDGSLAAKLAAARRHLPS